MLTIVRGDAEEHISPFVVVADAANPSYNRRATSVESSSIISNTDGFVRTTDCESVDEFLRCLDRRNGHLASGLPDTWIFRGHCDHTHQLIPKALRPTAQFRDLAGFDAEIEADQCFGEMRLLKDFFERADRIGLSLPEDTQILRTFFEREPRDATSYWPPEHLLSLMALAQHHGVPTRLLDWSRSPLKAAHFSAQPMPAGGTEPARLCVWVFSLLHHDLGKFMDLPYRLVTAPGATNSNLGAQEGVFTITSGSNNETEKVDRRPFDEVIRQWLQARKVQSRPEWFHCVTLPRSRAKELLHGLEIEGVTRATLFPNFYGVVATIEQSRRYALSEPPSVTLRKRGVHI